MKKIRRALGALALATAAVGTAQAGPLSYVFNYSGPANGHDRAFLNGYVLTGSTTTVSFFDDANLEGSLFYQAILTGGTTELLPGTLLGPQGTPFLDGEFSVLWTVNESLSGITIPSAVALEVFNNTIAATGTVGQGQDCRNGACMTTSVPEPASLALVALAALGGLAASRRR